MLKRTLTFALSLTVLVASSAWAADYLPDVLKKPAYLSSWKKLVANDIHGESWLRRYSDSFDGPSVPSKQISLSDGTYTAAWVCQTHNCGPRQFYVLFAPDGTLAWGILLKDTREDTVLGAPNEEKLAALRQLIRVGM